MIKIIFKVIIPVMAVLFAYSLIEPYLIEEKKTTIKSENIPESFNGFKIVFIADIHMGSYFSGERLKGVVERINKMNPDMIILGGDYIMHDTKDTKACFDILGGLKAGYGIFGVLGNHDYGGNETNTIKLMEKNGINYIGNRSINVNKSGGKIIIGGVGDLYHDIQEIEKTTDNAGVSDFVILVSHNPDYAEEVISDKIDIMLSGHLHGGQVNLFGLYAPLVPSVYGQKYISGLTNAPKTKVLVTNGLGMTGLPLRFFARPQINIIALEK